MNAKLYGKTLGVMVVAVCFMAGFSSPALAKWGIENGWGSSSSKTVSSSAASFTSKGAKGGWGHTKTSDATTNPTKTTDAADDSAKTVTADVSGVFNGQAYTKTETKTSTITLHNGKEITTTSVSYLNDKGQKVGVKSTGGFADRETTYEYDAAGNVSKQVTVRTTHGWTNKPENGGNEFTRTITTTSLFTYEDVKDDAGNVTGKKVTETSTSTREVNGETKANPQGSSGRVVVTVTDTAGKEISKSYTTNFTDGHKKVTEKVDGKWKTTYYDKDGKVYVPEVKDYDRKEILKKVFAKTKKSTDDDESKDSWGKSTSGSDMKSIVANVIKKTHNYTGN